ncbi:unnamed protein product [Owenia fusiformis]|uniref:Actin-related protein 2/3 complex subunit n=1 Tax=Owenia fusiformis TaxID=6347 RepID=A0A8J1UAG7_OWEFU|nr:unnamed protein product [Owenia fusiformis]
MAVAHSFGTDPITCHAWNKDRSQIAVCPNSSNVIIYTLRAGRWEETAVLKEHTQRVTGIDWAVNSNLIVTCSADRNAYVWNLRDGEWKPTLVILRINRAATCVKWSPKENKFAVGSGARLISVCYFEKENDWWVSKHIKKPIRSTVTSIDWHPNNILIGCGSTDFKARVFSAYIKDIEDKPTATVWGKKMTFGNLMAEFSNGGGGWVHYVAFSASGDKLAWVGHDASVSVVDSNKEMLMATAKTAFLPFMCCEWVSENSLVVAGHSCNPMLFLHDDRGQMQFLHKLDVEKQSEGGKINAMKRFQMMDKQADESVDKKLGTVHQNSITGISIHSGSKASTQKFATVGVDGQMCLWDFKTLESSIAGLRLQ